MTPRRITIEADLTRDGLLALRADIDALLRDLGASGAGPVDPQPALNADRKVGDIWARVGGNIKLFLVIGARLNAAADAEFSMDSIADITGVNVKSIRSWHRNLGRSLRQVDDAIPEPQLMLARWDGERQQYRFDPAIRAAILDRFAQSGLPDPLGWDLDLGVIGSELTTSPLVALGALVEMLEKTMRSAMSSRNRFLDGLAPDIGFDELLRLARETRLIGSVRADELRAIAAIRDRGAEDLSGTSVTAADVQDALAVVRPALFNLIAAGLDG